MNPAEAVQAHLEDFLRLRLGELISGLGRMSIGIDAVLVLAVELLGAVAGVVIVGVLHLPTAINAILVVLGGCLAVIWSVGYLVAALALAVFLFKRRDL